MFENFADPFEWWEKAKLSFKRTAIRRATIIGKIQRHERFVLQSRLDKLQEQAKNGTTSDIEQYLLLLYGSVSRGLGTTKFTNLIG